MKIPNQIKIGGQLYKVKETEGMIDSGNTDTKMNIILIKKEMIDIQKQSTLLHEILEAINENNDLQLPHQSIQTLENCLYEVLTDNKLF